MSTIKDQLQSILTNELPHIKSDLFDLRKDIGGITRDITHLKEQVACIQGELGIVIKLLVGVLTGVIIGIALSFIK